MTKFQALFVLWLRHEEFCGCSWRALAGHYAARYGVLDNSKRLSKRLTYEGFGGNQIDGIEIEREAFNVLLGDVDPMIVGMEYDLFECDLTYINANIKRHLVD